MQLAKSRLLNKVEILGDDDRLVVARPGGDYAVAAPRFRPVSHMCRVVAAVGEFARQKRR